MALVIFGTRTALQPYVGVLTRCPAPLLRRFSTQMPLMAVKTFELQDQLPRLPIPDLQATAQRYLRSVVPLSPSAEHLQATQRAVQEFCAPGGFGETLQARLREYDQQQPASWLEDIWLNKGYLEWREPIFINISWWAQLSDSPILGVLKGNNHPAPGTFTDVQLDRAAALVHGLTAYQCMLHQELVPPDSLRNSPLCMNQYRYQFSTSRIPQADKDTIVHEYPSTANHIIVMARDQILRVQVLSNQGELLPREVIRQQLQKVVQQVEQLTAPEPAVGVLTTDNRAIWARERENLAQTAPQNAANFATIDSALFAICLEDQVDPLSATDTNRAKDYFFHNTNGHNRWMDKSIQLIVLNNGRTGMNGEHTPSDAATPGAIMSYVLAQEARNEIPKSADHVRAEDIAPPELLHWKLASTTQGAIVEATDKAAKLASLLRAEQVFYRNYGGKLIKEAKVSPDSYVQMALQLAYYRLHGKPCPTYETASTRAFLHGRTETVRSCSQESLAFTRGFLDPQVTRPHKQQLFLEAINSHKEYMKAASVGQGVDRHLLGLRCMIHSPEEQTRASLFNDPAYVNSMSFVLSTSNLSPGTYLYGGFAPGVQDGYGSNYAIGKDYIRMSVTTWGGLSKETDASAFKDAVEQSLDDLRNLVTK
ncbi:Carnitine O-acetyltransferase mitochondrial [Dispira parvispora]|uniref:Carnitine O-acetyltransferase mitochondrial n=1 Tax=Dispira parvispora TaxID=1520584 RepID=A0A9W8E3R3_9FUNG|nr:Carnitine O-acetyltransferase mitochondrial [Dispira parvispora]